MTLLSGACKFSSSQNAQYHLLRNTQPRLLNEKGAMAWKVLTLLQLYNRQKSRRGEWGVYVG